VRPGELRSVIGPNGAGKTTFFNLLTGVLPPSAGRILFKGRDVTGLPAHRVSRLGIARSYQVTNIFGDLTVLENVRIAAQSRVTHYRFWGSAESLRGVTDHAEEILRHLGLAAKRDALARELSHGEQRQLEIILGLASDPKILLLDEPAAGLSSGESTEMVHFLQKLDRNLAILLIEHVMRAVMALAGQVVGAPIGVTTDDQASWWGGKGVGTVPHSLIASYGGNTVLAATKFAEWASEDMNIVVLVDFENDSVRTALEVARALGIAVHDHLIVGKDGHASLKALKHI